VVSDFTILFYPTPAFKCTKNHCASLKFWFNHPSIW
jgi:hypothetical protein